MKTNNQRSILIIVSASESLLNFRGPLLKEMVSQGWQVYVTAPNFSDEEITKLNKWNVNVHQIKLSRTGINIFADLYYSIMLYQFMRRVLPDIILTYTIKPNIWGAFAARAAGIPSFANITGLGYAFTQGLGFSLKQKIIRSISKNLYRLATCFNKCIIFQNPDDIKDFISMGILYTSKKTRIINGSGVDLSHYTLADLPETPTFLMIARLLKNKGVREYGEAVLNLKIKYPYVRFLLVGYFDEGPDGIKKQDLNRWEMGGLEYLGPKLDVRPIIKTANVFVLPSYREGTPRSVLEAMAMGRPIITTDVPGCRETVIHGNNGFLIPPKDVKALKQIIENFIENPAKIVEMGEKSYQFVCEKYDVDKVNKSILKILVENS